MKNPNGTLDQLLAHSRAKRRLPAPPVRRALRESAGLSQQALASYLEVERATVSRWEGGARTPRGATLERYVEVLDRLAVER